MRSSYLQNNFGEVFGAIIDGFKPKLCVELGVLDGYSAIAIGQALKKIGAGGTLKAYDLFEAYQYKHGSQEAVEWAIAAAGLMEVVSLEKADAYNVASWYHSCSVDLLHVDISNTGETIDMIMEQWDDKMVVGGIILFEGGSEERDLVEWMKAFEKKPIKPAIENNQIIKDKYIYGTYFKFPGLTMCLKKR